MLINKSGPVYVYSITASISGTFSNYRTNVMWIMCHHRYWEWIMPALAVIIILELIQNTKVFVSSNSEHPTLRTEIYIYFGSIKKWSEMSVFKLIVIRQSCQIMHYGFAWMYSLKCSSFAAVFFYFASPSSFLIFPNMMELISYIPNLFGYQHLIIL